MPVDPDPSYPRQTRYRPQQVTKAVAADLLRNGQSLQADERAFLSLIVNLERIDPTVFLPFWVICDRIKRRWASTGRAEERLESSLDSARGGLASSAPVSPPFCGESAAGVRAGGGPRIVAAEPLEILDANAMQ